MNYIKHINKTWVILNKKNLKNIDSISNYISNGESNIYEYQILIDNKKVNLIGKFKKNSVVINGIKLMSCNNFNSFLTILFNHKVFGYNNSYYRESVIYNNIDKSLSKYLLKFYGSYSNRLLGTNFLLLEKFNDNLDINIYSILDALVNIHSFYYNDEYCIKLLNINSYSVRDYKKCKSAIKCMYSSRNNIKDYGERNNLILLDFINNIDIEYQKYIYHRTLTHNDLSNRNIHFDNNKCIFYDWELSCYQNPEHDLIDILVYNFDKYSKNEIKEFINYYKNKLFKKINVNISNDEYKNILIFNLKEYMVNKLAMLRIYNKNRNILFIKNLTKNANDFLNLLLEGDIV